jgi:hypothetical protein
MIKGCKQTNKLPNGNDPYVISFDEFVKYSTGYSSYEELEKEMNKEKGKGKSW